MKRSNLFFSFWVKEHELTVRLTKEQLDYFNHMKTLPNIDFYLSIWINADVTIPDILYLYCYRHERKNPDKIIPVLSEKQTDSEQKRHSGM